MTIDVAEEPMTVLAEYAPLPIAFRVDQVLNVTARADGGFAVTYRCCGTFGMPRMLTSYSALSASLGSTAAALRAGT